MSLDELNHLDDSDPSAFQQLHRVRCGRLYCMQRCRPEDSWKTL
jgi:hypothetical protein